MRYFTILLSAAAFTLSACTTNVFNYFQGSGNTGSGSQNSISLRSDVRFGTAQRLQDTQIFNGQPLSLFVTRTGSVTLANQLYYNNRITANGSGGFTYTLPMFYPSDGTGVDFYAVHPYFESAALITPMTFSIQADQSVQTNYLNSDLLYGTRTNVMPQTAAVPLTFYHRLSKLDFVITSRSAAIDLTKLTEIDVFGVLPQTTIDLRTGRRTAAAGSPTTIKAYGTPVVSGSAGNQTVTGFTAIIVPQTMPGTQRLFGLMIDGRMVYHTPADDFGFASGTKYTVMLDVSDTGITQTSQIADWTDGGSIGGSAGPQ